MITTRSRKRGYEALRITARLRCGVLSDGLLPLDAILYWAHHRDALATLTPGRRLRAPRARVPHDDGPETTGPLPLQIINPPGPGTIPGGHWHYAASCAVWPAVVAEGIDYWTKRIDTQYLDILEIPRARIPVSSGPYRAYRMPLVYRHALVLTWYAVGDRARITYLLSLVRHVGKKAAMGWGEVIDWTVEPHAEDWSVWGPEGRLMRPIPDEGGVLYGLRPPYWLPQHQTLCRLPDDTGAAAREA